MSEQQDITALLADVQAGRREAIDQLTPLLYDELRRLAHQKLYYERAHHTLNTTALVHEAYLELVDQTRVSWQSRAHFMAAAAQSMRYILLHYAERRRALKRGGNAKKVSFDEVHDEITDERADELLVLDETIKRLADFDAQGAQIVEYRFFGGLTQPEIAEVMGLSERTVRRRWQRAKAWIRREVQALE